MRILAVIASQAGGNTDRLVRRVLEAAGEGPGAVEIETIWSRLREEVVRAMAADRGAGSDGIGA